MNKSDVTFVIPSKNNLEYLKMAFDSLIKFNPESKFVLLDDCSQDGTEEYLKSIQEKYLNVKIYSNKESEPLGIAYMYNYGASLAETDIIMFFHADMIASEKMVDNLLKYMKEKTVVSATRIEPPLHNRGLEKIIIDCGIWPDKFDQKKFDRSVRVLEQTYKDETTGGIFAPWMIFKKDFENIGGHDYRSLKSIHEDSDIFQRFMLAGYKIIQSRDAFVYHMTCRGLRFGGIDKNGRIIESVEYKNLKDICMRNFLRKWQYFVHNDKYLRPVIHPKYDIGYVIQNCDYYTLHTIEPRCSNVYVNDSLRLKYINNEQSKTKTFDISKRVLKLSDNYINDIIINFDFNDFQYNMNENYKIILKMPDIIKDSGEIGEFRLGIFHIKINSLKTYENDLVYLKN